MATLQITKDLANNRYKVTPDIINVTAADQAKLDDYSEPSVTMGGTIDVVSTATPLNISGLTGTFVVGEIVTDDGGTPGSGTVYKVVSGVIWVKDVTASFNAAATLTGATSAATATIDTIGTTITQFQDVYAVAPQSTITFTVNSIIRNLPTGLPITFSINGDTEAEAEENAEDLCVTLGVDITAAWNATMDEINNFERVDTLPLNTPA